MTPPRKPPRRCQDCNWPIGGTYAVRCRDCYLVWVHGGGIPEPPPAEPDWVVIDRLIAGTPVESTHAERVEAVRVMTGRGMTADLIAARMHCSERAVVRMRRRVRAAA